jgi:hypothetical protein
MISLQPCHLTEPSECQALVDFAVRDCLVYEFVVDLYGNPNGPRP